LNLKLSDTSASTRLVLSVLKLCAAMYLPKIRVLGLAERRYSSYLFTTSALDGGEGSASLPGGALPPEKGPPVPIVQKAGWAPEPV
jgi:hypothetical protein